MPIRNNKLDDKTIVILMVVGAFAVFMWRNHHKLNGAYTANEGIVTRRLRY